MEGGTRVPCILRWPGVIPADGQSNKLATAIDLLPTLAHACGIELKEPAKAAPKIDGLNLWETFTGKSTSHPRKDLIYWQGWAVPQAIRVGDWKLYFDHVKEVAGSAKGPVLIDLSKDPAEEKDLSAEHPDKVKEMLALARTRLKDIEQNTIELGGPPVAKKAARKGSRWLK